MTNPIIEKSHKSKKRRCLLRKQRNKTAYTQPERQTKHVPHFTFLNLNATNNIRNELFIMSRNFQRTFLYQSKG